MAIYRPGYCTRETIFRATDAEPSLRARALADDAIEAAAGSVEATLHRVFYPSIGTRYFRWPDPVSSRAWRLWLRDSELVTLTGLSSGGTTIPTANALLEPNTTGPPYSSIELNTATVSAYGANAGSEQRAVAVTGVFGFSVTTAAATTLAAAINASVTTLNVANSAPLGVGDLAMIDTEYLLITDTAMLTTGQTLQTPIGATSAEVTLAVTTGSAYAAGETLLLDSERMEIEDIAGNNLTVRRAVQGSVLASHTGSTIYAPRTLSVTRGAQGSTAASHLISVPVLRHVVPGLVRQLALAEALTFIAENGGAWARPAGQGGNTAPQPGSGLPDLRWQAFTQFGRLRLEAV